ncbi:MAG: EAL domain-containing protein [Succinivibrio sp.]|nr:EAL domain-containing protein [Succinivibrio sp.]
MKAKYLTSVLAGFILSALSFLVTGSAVADELTISTDSTTAQNSSAVSLNPKHNIRAGFVSAPGYISANRDGIITGLIYDYTQMVATYAGLKISFSPCTPERCQTMLEQGDLDLLLNVVKTEEHNPNYIYSDNKLASMALNISHNEAPAGTGIFNVGWRYGFSNAVLSFADVVAALDTTGMEYGLDYTLMSYADPFEMFEDYRIGKLDGIIYTANQITANQIKDNVHINETLTYLDTFIVAKKDNKEIIDKINQGARDLLKDFPLYREQLYARYMSQEKLELDKAELNFIKEHPEIEFLAVDEESPYGDFINGQFEGALHDIIKEILGTVGVEATFSDAPDYANMLGDFNSGRGTAIASFISDFNWARINDVNITIPYTNLNYVVVNRKGETLPQDPIIASVDKSYNSILLFNSKGIKGTYENYPTYKDCLAAVLDGEADCTFLNDIIARRILDEDGYEGLETDGKIAFSMPIGFALHRSARPELMSILNKAIANADKVKINSAIEKLFFHENFTITKSFLKRVYRANPFLIQAAGSLIAALLLLLIIFLIVRKIMLKHHFWKDIYTERNTGLHNFNWIDRFLQKKIDLLKANKKKGKLFILVLTIKELCLLAEKNSQQDLGKLLRDLFRKIEKEHDFVEEIAVESGFSHIFLLCSIPDGETAAEVTHVLLDKLIKCRICDNEIHLNFNAGICQLPLDKTIPVRTLMANAVEALNEAASNHRVVGVFKDEIRQRLLRQSHMLELMTKAMKNHEFKIWLQPKYELTSHKIIGAEALVRWDSPELGFIMPSEFIKLFENNSSVYNLDYYMLEGVCALQAERAKQGLTMIPVSVNQSSLHISEEGYLRRMKNIADKFKLEKGSIELELTDISRVDISDQQNLLKIQHLIAGLRELGYEISMDDSCSGYSSLAIMQGVEMTTINLDRILLESAEKSPRAETLLRKAIEFGHGLNMRVLCKGVERPEQEEILRRNGCNMAQGYLFAKPMPIAEFNTFVGTLL